MRLDYAAQLLARGDTPGEVAERMGYRSGAYFSQKFKEATGNTPIMDWNIFNGMRTLSANIATELPEAAQDSTHYRVLFLGALILFSMTFLLNTLAEIVRQRLRKRFNVV